MKVDCVSEPEINPAQAVPRIHCPSLDRFRSDFLDPQKPVIIEGITDHWLAFTEHPWRYWKICTIRFDLLKLLHTAILYTLSKHRILANYRWLPDCTYWSGIQVHWWRVVTKAHYSEWLHRPLHYRNSKNYFHLFHCKTVFFFCLEKLQTVCIFGYFWLFSSRRRMEWDIWLSISCLIKSGAFLSFRC